MTKSPKKQSDDKIMGLPETAGASPPIVLQRSLGEATTRKKRFNWVWAGVTAIISISAISAYSIFGTGRPTPVLVETAASAPIVRLLAVNGRIAALHPVEVRSVVTGTLKELLVEEGDMVTADQVLAEVDNTADQAAVRQARAALETARVALQEATESYDRAVSLGKNIARVELDSRAFGVQSATSDVGQKTAMLDRAFADLETYTIHAPIAGRVMTLDVENGQVVGPSIPLLTLADLGALIVEADVDEVYATQIAEGQPAILQMAGEVETRSGYVSFVSTRVSIATGGLAIKITYDAPVIAPIGLTVTTNIIVEQRDAALTIPRTAMVKNKGETKVFLFSGGAAQLQPVTVIDWPAERLIVTDGLAEGDVIIVDADGLLDGQAVSVGHP